MSARRKPPARREGSAAVRSTATERLAGARLRSLGWWLAAATLALPPLFVLPQGLDSFRLPQRMATEWLALLSLLALAPALAWRRGRELLAAPAARAVLPLLVVAVVGGFASPHPAHVQEALLDLLVGAAALVGWSLALSPRSLRRLLDATLAPAVVLALMAILQVNQLWQPVTFSSDPGSERLKVTAFAGNPGDLAALLVLPCLVAQSRLAERRPRRWAWALALLLSVYAIVASQTITSLGALLAGSALLWAVRLGRLLRTRRVGLGVAASVAALMLVLLAVPALRERGVAFWQRVARGDMNDALSGRLDAWRAAEELLREHPLAGVGHGAFRAEFGNARLRLVQRGVPFYVGHVNPSFSNVHDEYLEVAADTGWPGVLALAWGIWVLARAARRAWPRWEPAERGLVAGGGIAVALLAVAYFPFRLAPVAFGWLALFAWVGAAAMTGDELAEPVDERAHRKAAVTLAAILLLAVVGQTMRGGARIASTIVLRTVQQQMTAVTKMGRAPGSLIEAELRALAGAHRMDPAAIEPLAFRADVLLVARRTDEAERAYRTAIAHEPRPEVLFNHGLLLWQQGRNDEAAVEFRRAVALAPRFAQQLPYGADGYMQRTPLEPLPPARALAADAG